MAWGLVQTPVGTHVGTAGTTVARAMPSNPVIGSKIIVGVAWNLATGTASVADTLGHTYTAVPGSLVNDGSATVSIQWFWADVTSTGANTVTATMPSNPQHDIFVYEVSGLQAGAADIAAVGSSGAGNSTATFTTTAANDFIAVATVNLGTPAPPTGYTLRLANTTIQRSWTKDDPTPAGSVANTETGGAGGSLSAVAFKIVPTATAVYSPLLSMLVQGGLQRAKALLLIHPPVVATVAAPVDANLSASGGTASAAGGSVTLAVTLDASGGTATADGGTAAFSDRLTAAAGTATAAGGTAGLSFTYLAASGAATAGGGTVSTVLPAAGGTASASGGTVTLTVGLSASGGAATASGGTVTGGEALAVTSGTATAGGGTAALTFVYPATGGSATAGGGTVSTSDTLAAAAGTATAGGGTASLTFVYASSGGAATAGGGTDALTFIYGLSGGTATAGGGDTTASVGGASNVSSSGGTATGSGGTVSFAVGLTSAGGAATAAGGTLSLTVALTASGGTATADGGTVTVDGGAVVEPPPVDTGPTGGRYEPGGDESSITGRSARITSGRGHGYGWGTRAHVSARSRPRLRIKLPSRRRERSREVVSRFGAGQGRGSVARLSTRSALRAEPGAGVGWGGMGRALPPVNGTPLADDALDDLAALTLLGVL